MWNNLNSSLQYIWYLFCCLWWLEYCLWFLLLQQLHLCLLNTSWKFCFKQQWWFLYFDFKKEQRENQDICKLDDIQEIFIWKIIRIKVYFYYLRNRERENILTLIHFISFHFISFVVLHFVNFREFKHFRCWVNEQPHWSIVNSSCLWGKQRNKKFPPIFHCGFLIVDFSLWIFFFFIYFLRSHKQHSQQASKVSFPSSSPPSSSHSLSLKLNL